MLWVTCITLLSAYLLSQSVFVPLQKQMAASSHALYEASAYNRGISPGCLRHFAEVTVVVPNHWEDEELDTCDQVLAFMFTFIKKTLTKHLAVPCH